MQEDCFLWKQELFDKYGDKAHTLMEQSDNFWHSYASSWWKDLMLIGEDVGASWFVN